MAPDKNQGTTKTPAHALYSDGSDPSQTGNQYSEYANEKGTTTAQTQRKRLGSTEQSNHTTHTENKAIKTAPELRDRDSTSVFIRGMNMNPAHVNAA